MYFFFFFNDTATTEIYTLSLHDALPISSAPRASSSSTTIRPTLPVAPVTRILIPVGYTESWPTRSEEHTSELQSRQYLVCRLLLEKKKQIRMKEQKDERKRQSLYFAHVP